MSTPLDRHKSILAAVQMAELDAARQPYGATGVCRLQCRPMYWHVCFTVPDLDSGMEQFTQALGAEWRPVRSVSVQLRDDQGVIHDISTRVTFSCGGAPGIELLEEVKGTPLESRGSAFHHIGYWTDDHDGEQRRLEGLGFNTFASAAAKPGRAKQAATSVLLINGPFGVGLEPCDVTEDRAWGRDFYPESSEFHGEPDFT